MKKNKLAITIVELIVVVTILAILGTVGFLSYQNYTVYSRDVVRVTDISNIKSVLEFTYTESGLYPKPDNGEEVTYSGGTVWTQGTFGKETRRKTKRLNEFPVDPLVGVEYTYSVLNTGREYELGAVFELDEVAINPKVSPHLASPKGRGIIGTETYADESNFKSYITGTYNGQVAKVRTGSIEYVLALPSIISTDLTNVTVESIILNKKLSLKGFKNIPHSYGVGYVPTSGDDVKFVNPNKYVVWSGSVVDLKYVTIKQKIPTYKRLGFFTFLER